jgi:hypothetical protein
MNFFVSEHRLFNRKGQDIGRDPPLITPTEKPKINPLKCIQMITCNHALRISGVDRTGSGTKRGIASEALSWLKYRSGASSKTAKEDTAKKYFIHIYVTMYIHIYVYTLCICICIYIHLYIYIYIYIEKVGPISE